ncbi:hypothetical protein [uncultured Imperialibacter sp.]|uniref:hypothetical protein n=1 Tax=uncultured Imperialibacter sp. TaxID=1672639 RepID=UPI0030DC0FC5|tara:strand:- start:34885 stop:35889 length:1005 start_codon:yes stop_codon:yes gene_type:complete
MMKHLFTLLLLLASAELFSQSKAVPVPTIEGSWWRIASNPDLGLYNSDKQQPVDFGIWQAADGTWQVWSCIRGSKHPGTAYTTRFLYGWEGKNLTDKNWSPQGIKWVADPTLGETPGGMQAPYVHKEGGVYYLFYGDWQRICLAKGTDGKHFERVLGGNGQPDLFAEYGYAGNFKKEGNPQFESYARDPMVIKRGNTYYCYYTSHLTDPINDGAAFVRTSVNMRDWSESAIISHTPPYNFNSPRYSDECPHVVYLPEYDLYYLFVTQTYGQKSQTTVYASTNPYYFGVDDDSNKVCSLPIAAPEIVLHEGQYYLVALTDALDGIRMARLRFVGR